MLFRSIETALQCLPFRSWLMYTRQVPSSLESGIHCAADAPLKTDPATASTTAANPIIHPKRFVFIFPPLLSVRFRESISKSYSESYPSARYQNRDRFTSPREAMTIERSSGTPSPVGFQDSNGKARLNPRYVCRCHRSRCR